MSSDPMLPASDSYDEGKSSCASSIAAASAKLIQCLTSATTNFQVDGDAALFHLKKCACYFNFREVGKECTYTQDSKDSSSLSHYAYTLSNETKACADHWKAWESQQGKEPFGSWWSSSEGCLAQLLIVVLFLAVLAWCSQDYLRGFLNNFYDELEDEAREVEALARAAESKVEEAEHMMEMGLVRPPMIRHVGPQGPHGPQGPQGRHAMESAMEREPSTEDDVEIEEPEEIPEPKRSLHKFQAPRDLGFGPHVPLINQSLFPPGTAPP